MTDSCPQTVDLQLVCIYEQLIIAWYTTYEVLQCFDFEQKLTQFFVNLALGLPFTPSYYVRVLQGIDATH